MLKQSLEMKTLEQLLVCKGWERERVYLYVSESNHRPSSIWCMHTQAEMDTKWRERVLEVYGKREGDFADAGAYNDYVEKREDLSTCWNRAGVCVWA